MLAIACAFAEITDIDLALWNSEPFPLGIDLNIYTSIVNTISSGQSMVAREGLRYNARDINPRLFVANYGEPSKSGVRQVSPVTYRRIRFVSRKREDIIIFVI